MRALFLCSFFILCFSVNSAPVTTKYWDPFLAFENVTSYSIPPKVLNFTSTVYEGEIVNFNGFFAPVKKCRYLSANISTEKLCGEIFDVLTSLCHLHPNEELPVDKDMSLPFVEDACSAFEKSKAFFSKEGKHLSAILKNNTQVCKEICNNDVDVLCRYLLWIYEAKSIFISVLPSMQHTNPDSKRPLTAVTTDTMTSDKSRSGHTANMPKKLVSVNPPSPNVSIETNIAPSSKQKNTNVDQKETKPNDDNVFNEDITFDAEEAILAAKDIESSPHNITSKAKLVSEKSSTTEVAHSNSKLLAGQTESSGAKQGTGKVKSTSGSQIPLTEGKSLTGEKTTSKSDGTPPAGYISGIRSNDAIKPSIESVNTKLGNTTKNATLGKETAVKTSVAIVPSVVSFENTDSVTHPIDENGDAAKEDILKKDDSLPATKFTPKKILDKFLEDSDINKPAKESQFTNVEEYDTSLDENSHNGVEAINPRDMITENEIHKHLDQEDSHFFLYFLLMVAIVFGGYVAYHNKQKIFALILEGRHERKRRPRGVSYRKLETN